MNTIAAVSASRNGTVRKFTDLYPAIKDRCLKYTRASKWNNLEKMTPGLAKLWVQQLSLWTRSTFKARGHVFASCPVPAIRKALIDVVGEEDVVDPRVGMNHRQLMVSSFGRATGQTLQDLEKVRPLATTLITLDLFHGIASRTWEEGVAVMSGHERVLRDSGFFGQEVIRMKRDLGWSDEDVAWFTGHDVADEDHGKIVEMLDDYVRDAETWDRVEEAVVQSQIAWLIFLDGVVDAWREGIEPVSGRSCKGLSFYY